MYRSKIILLAICCLFCYRVRAQSPPKLSISEIQFVDPEIETYVQAYVDSLEQASDHWASGKGYLTAYLSQPRGSSETNNPIVRFYKIYPSVVDFDTAEDTRFPFFYTFLAGRMCLVDYSDISINYFMKYSLKKGSKRRFKRLIAPFLFDRINRRKEDMPKEFKKGSKFYRPTPWLYLHPLRLEIAVYYDGTITVRQTNEYY